MNIALILSGGIGSRVGADIPKQYIKVNNQMIITYCIRTLSEHPMIDAIQIVADSQWKNDIIMDMQANGIEADKIIGYSVPGKNRQLSICNGMADVKKAIGEDAVIFIHDAARPRLTARQVTECINAMHGHDGVLPVLPMKDTVYMSSNGKTVTELLDRSRIYAGQSPEVFCMNKYMDANERLMPNMIMNINGSTEPAIMAGMDIAMIQGDEGNYKITTKEDLERFSQLI